MQLTKPKEPDHVWINISKRGCKNEKFCVWCTDLNEFVPLVKDWIMGEGVSIFEHGGRTSVVVKQNSDGIGSNFSFVGLDPKELTEVIKSKIEEYDATTLDT